MGKRPHWKFDPEHRVNFGKHRGRQYKDVPTEYLVWFVKNGYRQMINRKSWAEQELARRKINPLNP